MLNLAYKYKQNELYDECKEFILPHFSKKYIEMMENELIPEIFSDFQEYIDEFHEHGDKNIRSHLAVQSITLSFPIPRGGYIYIYNNFIYIYLKIVY